MSKLTKDAYAKLVAEDIAALKRLMDAASAINGRLEVEHAIAVLEYAVASYGLRAENEQLRAENESWQLRFNCPCHGHKDWDAECRCDLSRDFLAACEPADPESGGGR